ncbi:MAG: Gfo/Idh/MocA family oxidoreductase [Opitutaceae bacterium]|jgi:predicted dehydrogenase|nr:Gfo/Idh/MocA family oxidoreductase [Opitutaceae bacterium]
MPSARPARKKPAPIRVAILGTGGMANRHAELYKQIPGVQLVAACDIDRARVEAYAAKHGIPASGVFTDFAKLLRECPCDAVSNVTPDAFHAPLSIQALKAGKHVLCEKPLGLDHAETKRMVAAAKKAGTVAMVNFSYRDWSALQAIAARVHAGEIGELRHVEASYLQTWLTAPIWGEWSTTPAWLWRLSSKHGSKGVLGDVGVHIVDFATYPAGPIKTVFAKLKTFPKAPKNRIGDYVLDANDSAVINVEFANGALGTIHTTRFATGHPNRLALKLHGTKGAFSFDSDLGTTTYRACVGKDAATATWKDVQAKPTPNNHTRFITAIRTGQADQPDFARGSQIQRVLDACFESDASGQPVKI